MSEWLKLIFPGIMIVKATPANAGKETTLGRSELPLVVIGGAAGSRTIVNDHLNRLLRDIPSPSPYCLSLSMLARLFLSGILALSVLQYAS